MGPIVGILVVILAIAGGALAVSVAGDAFRGSRYVSWSADPVVFMGELALAAGSVLVVVAIVTLAVRSTRTGPRGDVDAAGWVGLGFLAIGVISIAVGWLGLKVPTTPGYDVLSRGEPLYMIRGAVSCAFGLLVLGGAAVASALTGGQDRTGGGAAAEGPDRPVDPGPSTWRVSGTTLLHGAMPGDLVDLSITSDGGLDVALSAADATGRRLASYPAGVRLEPVGEGAYRLSYGQTELALLTPVDLDPGALVAALGAGRP